jgi:TPR repeat protein
MDLDKAEQWLRKAAEQGNVDASALLEEAKASSERYFRL